ncbi:MAG: decarboxylase [Butyrivibrio sp.]|nr:decarboxylase [Butyrivibrio sp.]
MSELYTKLEVLNKSDMVPLHMPGHKRNSDAGTMSKYYDIDITEIDGFDNLHDAEDIILEAEKRANKLYGAEETHFLVNGSSCGVLSAVSAAVPKGGKIIAARSCHKSFFHAAYLRELDIKSIYPQKKTLIEEKDGYSSDIYGEVLPEDIEKKIEENPDAAAVFITSPTYEGIPSDIRTIAKIVHDHNMILIVDAAHGAHFGLVKDEENSDSSHSLIPESTISQGANLSIPESAISQGADIVIHSLHKTLAAMTQTALIHVQGNSVDREKLRRYLRIYQTSSPSYVLMSSIDSCIDDILKRGNEIFSRLVTYKRKIEEETKECKHLYVPKADQIKDPGKVLICSTDGKITGKEIYDILRIEYKIQLEMAGDTYGLAIITGYDKAENIDRLINAINDIDKRLDSMKSDFQKGASDELSAKDSIEKVAVTYREMEKAFPFAKAWDAESELVDITRASGRVAADFVNLYPPGIPFIVPGEKFDKELVEQIADCINANMNVQGVEINGNKQRLIKVIKAENN